jgi:hypothetical protein
MTALTILDMESSLRLYTEGKGFADAVLIVEADAHHPWVQLISADFDSGKVDGKKLFYCMQSLHGMLDALDMKLLCNGFRYDVYPSGMALDMGHGMMACKMVKGQPAKELVNIIDPTDDIDAIVSVDEQKAFRREWLDSFRPGKE